jgi:G3E family GTPase
MAGIATAAIVGGAISAIGSIFGASRASKRARAAAREKKRLEGKLDALEKNRQAIINPYANVKDISNMAKDLSSMASNPYASLGVATQAAEMQIEEADIALANTLDTLRATGASAGGATALAQAALQSKKGVAASIEQQEVANEKLKADGKAQLERVKMGEAQRLQNIEMSEAQRMQQAEVAGKQFVFGQKESREMQQLNRVSSQISGAQQQQVAAQQASTQFLSAGIGAVGGIAASYAGK